MSVMTHDELLAAYDRLSEECQDFVGRQIGQLLELQDALTPKTEN